VLEQQGAEHFFGEPALKIKDIMRTTNDGRGAVSVLAADKLMMNPRLYATFLLWLLSELFEELPEVGDPDKPRLVFFFDEAHLLFDEAPKILVDRVEQVVRLIRSKGVGVYFVTQNPLDVPETVLSQLGNRVQHALRAYTPREQKAVKVAAETFRPNPGFDCFEAITQLGVGEALVSTLGAKGVPSMVERTLIRPPSSRLGPITEPERAKVVAVSPVAGQYDKILIATAPSRCSRAAPRKLRRPRRRNAAARRSRTENGLKAAAGPCPAMATMMTTMMIAAGAPRPNAGNRAAPTRLPAPDGHRGGDQVGGAVGRNITGTRFGPRHSGVHQEGLLNHARQAFRPS
jgi:hypothetical protein